MKNTYALRFAIIQDLFLSVLPLPLPLGHPGRQHQCFWASQDVTYDTQQHIIHHLYLLSRHFIVVALSLDLSHELDTARILTMASIAAIADAVLRKIATDTPSVLSLHYSGFAEGPLEVFGIQVSELILEVEWLRLTSPYQVASLTAVLDYFLSIGRSVREENMLFNFHDPKGFGPGELRLCDQLCLQMGFERTGERGCRAAVNASYPDTAIDARRRAFTLLVWCQERCC